MKFRNIYILSFLLVFLFTTIVYADIETDDEEINLNEIEQEIIQTSSDTTSEPDINSRAAIVIDRNSKTILYGKAETEQRKMASTTKIMTAIIVIENCNLSDVVTVSKKAASTGGSVLGIKTGDKISVRDLLYGLMLKSGNDTAVALAEHVGGSIEGFADMMNQKAQELGLTNTHFVTPHGLDNDDHYTTAYELALLTDYALENETFANYVATTNYTVTINGYSKTINNTNELLGHLDGVYGVKTGFTNGANRCLVTACKRGDLDIICVVLGADTKKFRTQDSMKLIEYCFDNYEMINLKQLVNDNFDNWKTSNLSEISVEKGVSSNLDITIKNFNYDYYPIKNEDKENINIYIDCNYNLEAPLYSETIIGTLYVNINNENVLNFDIVNNITIDKKTTLDYFYELMSNYFDYLTQLQLS